MTSRKALDKGGSLSEIGGHFFRPPTQGKGGQLMSIISLICDLVSAGCAVFGVLFSVYLYKQSHNDGNTKK